LESTKITHQCPCPKITCPRNGKCPKCTSHHLQEGKPNCCSFYAVLPILEEAISQSPETPTAKSLEEFIAKRKKRYAHLCEENGITAEEFNERLKNKAKFCSSH
jgi:hypothetical protein